MKNLLVGMLSALTIFSLSGCGGGGGGGGGTTPTTPTTPSNELADEYQGFAKLGSLSGATVKIYKINSDGTKEIKWIETTIDSRDLATSGAFNSHFKDFGYPSAYYLYEVSGGVDIDSDNDGVVDTNPKTNTGTMRAIVYSDDFKSYLDNELKITLLSEIVYQRVEDAISNDNFKLSTYLDNEAKYVLEKDINLDGKIDYDDVLSFNPVADADKVTQSFKDTNYDSYTNLLRYNSLDINPVTNLNITPNSFSMNNTSLSYQNLTNIAFSSDYMQLYTNLGYTTSSSVFAIKDLTNDTKTFVTHNGISNNNFGITINSNDTKAYFVSLDYTTKDNFLVIIDLLTKSLDRYITFNEDTTINSNVILVNNKAFVATNKGLAQIDLADYSISYLDTNISNHLVMSKDGKSIYGVSVADDKIGVFDTLTHQTNLIDVTSSVKFAVSSDENIFYSIGGSSLIITNLSTKSEITIPLVTVTASNIILNSKESKAYVAVGSYSNIFDVAVVDLNTTYVSYLNSLFSVPTNIAIKLGKDDKNLYISNIYEERITYLDVSSLN